MERYVFHFHRYGCDGVIKFNKYIHVINNFKGCDDIETTTDMSKRETGGPYIS